MQLQTELGHSDLQKLAQWQGSTSLKEGKVGRGDRSPQVLGRWQLAEKEARGRGGAETDHTGIREQATRAGEKDGRKGKALIVML